MSDDLRQTDTLDDIFTDLEISLFKAKSDTVDSLLADGKRRAVALIQSRERAARLDELTQLALTSDTVAVGFNDEPTNVIFFEEVKDRIEALQQPGEENQR